MMREENENCALMGLTAFVFGTLIFILIVGFGF